MKVFLKKKFKKRKKGMLVLFLATYYVLSIWKFLFNSGEFSGKNLVQYFPQKFCV
jgi:hypothetical protein